uniref:uncharacterized protein LOC131127624 isoform X2 n=1 Tax=Doryrhamphus excisus TaxID=161450 RepID=UPI0025AE2A4E|nr:uncharacterized protein LOC131127624 isoform X2 [Doryrhamphus excisus]
MLQEVIRERLMAAAEEIIGLFERTVTSYEEALCRTREENERQRRQLEAFHKTQVMLEVDDVQQPPHIKEEAEELWIAQKEARLLEPEEVDLTSAVPVKTEDPEDLPRAERLLAPLSDSDDTTSHSPEAGNQGRTREPLSSDTDCEGDMTNNKRSECAERETDALVWQLGSLALTPLHKRCRKGSDMCRTGLEGLG